ncbi:Asp23/Gls24 family envelope stress response protein [Streptomyces profundus]|uniref:Asp23/Gls24 family envelope stress response protein n=1 Tax=Streptomyces profundus TaxID=2867410 RepID=UPI001D162734|nr:Asp23/Gls24 family envelope stress response protein [Streptomyces sp. MA3_2.13]UED83479.1 Asp23/Gls24 family envelope stress response protein [Streptomyces sp. MA3_2.13]
MTVDQVVPARERGVTRIAERVVAKLATQAAREALRAESKAQPPRRKNGGPHASAVVRRPSGGDGSGGIASVRVAVELAYPSDIGSQCGAVRRQVARRIGELASMEVGDVAVAVERLHSTALDGEGSGRLR